MHLGISILFWSLAFGASFQTSLPDRSSYEELAFSKSGRTHVKYTWDLKTKETYFQNTKEFEYHYPFLKKTFPRFTDLSFDDYVKMVFEKEHKALTVGSVFYVGDLRIPQANGQPFIGYTVYSREKIDVAEIVSTHPLIKTLVPFSAGGPVFLLETSDDFSPELEQKGIPHINIRRIGSSMDHNGRCTGDQHDLSKKVTVGSANITFEGCGFQAAGHTTGFNITKIQLQDTSSELPPEKQGKLVTLENKSLSEKAKWKWNHHNGCDSVCIRAEGIDAEYGITTPDLAGCGSPVENAPKREFGDPIPNALYRVNYGKGFSKDLEADFKHYILGR